MLKEEDFSEYPPLFIIVEEINKLFSKNKSVLETVGKNHRGKIYSNIHG